MESTSTKLPEKCMLLTDWPIIWVKQVYGQVVGVDLRQLLLLFSRFLLLQFPPFLGGCMVFGPERWLWPFTWPVWAYAAGHWAVTGRPLQLLTGAWTSVKTGRRHVQWARRVKVFPFIYFLLFNIMSWCENCITNVCSIVMLSMGENSFLLHNGFVQIGQGLYAYM